MVKRSICHDCHYPVNTCICDYIEQVALPCRVIVLQHPKEALHAKNTVKLLSLVSPGIEIINSSDASAINDLINSLNVSKTAVFFPHESSCAMESYSEEVIKVFSSVIFIDASWKQAYGLFMQNPWIQDCQLLHFSHPTQSKYTIRKSKSEYQLSTLEAVSYAMSYMFKLDTLPFSKALDGLQYNWLKFEKKAR